MARRSGISTTEVVESKNEASTPVEEVTAKADYSGIECDGVRVRHFSPGGEIEAMYRHLASQDKVPFYCPLGWGEKDGAEQWYQANGLAVIIRKGQMVMIPKQVADTLMESLRLTENAIKPFIISEGGKVKRSTEARHPFASHGE